MSLTLHSTHEHHAAPIKGSRFRARVHPVVSLDQAMQVLRQIREAEPDATHHCWALRLQDGTTRCSDDGEPGGSAGRPILARLTGGDWIDVLVIVTRWYGGTKLGVGGLVRAYGGTTTEALAGAPASPWIATRTLVLAHDYADSGAVDGVLSAHQVTPTHTDWGARVVHTVVVPVDQASDLQHAITEATAGRATTEPGSQ